MRKTTATALLTTAAAAATLGLTATPAFAATTVTVTNPGGSTYTASSSSTVLSDNGVNVNCSGSAAAGDLPSASGVAIPAGVGTASSLSFSGCTGPLGTVTTTVSSLPYEINITAWDAANSRGTGYVGPVSVSVSMPLCTFDVTGNAPGYYDNTNHQLVLTPDQALPSGVGGLTVSNVSGCAGLVNNGDTPTYTSSYAVSPAITVTSP
jgi:hypothetical protein